MAAISTRLHAAQTALFMHEADFIPQAIVSLGCGYAGEVPVFRWLYPQCRFIGVDALDYSPYYTGEFFRAIVSNSTSPLPFYFRRHRPEASTLYPSAHVPYREQKRSDCPMMTLDQVWTQLHLTGTPTLLWLDAEGADRDIISSGKNAMRDCQFVAMEVADPDNRDPRAMSRQTKRWMARRGYRRVHVFPALRTIQNHLYRRVEA